VRGAGDFHQGTGQALTVHTHCSTKVRQRHRLAAQFPACFGCWDLAARRKHNITCVPAAMQLNPLPPHARFSHSIACSCTGHCRATECIGCAPSPHLTNACIWGEGVIVTASVLVHVAAAGHAPRCFRAQLHPQHIQSAQTALACTKWTYQQPACPSGTSHARTQQSGGMAMQCELCTGRRFDL
jgi:hypothetical protein